MHKIKPEPVQQPDGGIIHVCQGCKESCYTAPPAGMAMKTCANYLILFHVKERKIQEFCNK